MRCPTRRRRAPRRGRSALPAAALLVLGSLAVGGCSATSAPVRDATAPEPAVDDLAATFESLRAGAGLPAMAGAVWRGPTLLAAGVAGVRQAGAPERVSAEDRWHLGSNTKAMTATLVGIHVDRGTLSFDDTLATLFAGETLDPGYQEVTLLQLLQHRGGAPGAMPGDVWAQMWADGSDPEARRTAVAALLERPPAVATGSFEYSNAGYMIAGAALERRANATWERLLERDLFEPLGMASCGFGAPGTAGSVDEPWGHTVDADGAPVAVEPGPLADNPPSLGPAGTVHCSLADWGQFIALHLAGARGEVSELVSAATFERLHTPPTGGDYAGGWGVTERPWAGGVALTHSGSNTMWFATVWLAPETNLAFAVVTNQGDAAAAAAVDGAFASLIDAYAE